VTDAHGRLRAHAPPPFVGAGRHSCRLGGRPSHFPALTPPRNHSEGDEEITMLNKLLPRSLDNTYDGRKVALWILALVVLMKGAMGVNSIFNGYVVAMSADGIPLDTFTPAGARAVISFLALWGLSQLIFSLLGVLALVRYRAMVPLVFFLLLLELLSRKSILLAMPVAQVGLPPAFSINAALIGLMAVGLILSLWSRNKQGEPS
jgi:hypothetical protein